MTRSRKSFGAAPKNFCRKAFRVILASQQFPKTLALKDYSRRQKNRRKSKNKVKEMQTKACHKLDEICNQRSPQQRCLQAALTQYSEQ